MTRLPKRMLFPTTTLVVFLIVALLGWSNYRVFENRLISQLTLDESALLSQGSSLFSRELGHIKTTTLFLRNSVYALSTSHQHTPHSALWQANIPEIFTQFAQTSSFISQVRWLDSGGQELVRINARNGQTSQVPKDQLQDKSERYYFQQASSATGNNVYISPVDLNIENDQIVRPLEPTLRGVIKLDRFLAGVLVVNYDLTKLFQRLRALSNDNVFLDVVSAKGEWLISQDAQQEWATTLDHDENTNQMKVLYPDVWESIRSESGLSSRLSGGQIWSSMKVMVENETPSLDSESGSYVYFIARSQLHVLDKQRQHLQWLIGAISGAVFFVLCFIIWWQMNMAYKRRALLAALETEQAQLRVANNEFTMVNHQLVELQGELVENSKLAALGLMVAGLAHEMNTPLGGVRMALSSLLAQVKKDAERLPEQSLTNINKSIEIADKNLNRAINLVVSFKRITLDRSGQDVQTFLFNSVLQDLLMVYNPRLKRSPQITIVEECDENIEMQGFPGILSQMLQNFIDNALQHGFKGRQQGTITLTAKQQNEQLVLSIKDNGCGISPEVEGHIYEPFITTGRVDKHTGLGLHLVHQWVYKLMNGRIEVTSIEGKGTCFTVFIPLIQQREASADRTKGV